MIRPLLIALLALAIPLNAETAVEEVPVVVLGGGVAALTAANYLARGGVTPIVLTGPLSGGAITQSHSVQNWPAEKEITGIELTEKMRSQAEANGAVFRAEEVVSVDFSKRPFLIQTRELFSNDAPVKTLRAQACIIALGATPNLLGIAGEETYWSRGVYSCAVCDGGFYKDKTVAVVGGGDSALTEAHYLSNIADKVYLIVRKDQFRTVEKKRAIEILSRANIEVLYESIITEVKGDDAHATTLVIQDLKTQTTRDLPVDALFLAIGSTPNTALFQNQLDLDSAGYIVLKNKQESSVAGVYAIGDIVDPEFKQAISAAGDGAKAALQAQKELTAFTSQSHAKTPSIPQRPLVIEIQSEEQFAQELKQAKGPIFIDFYTDYCGPCRMFSPIYHTWAEEFQGRITFLKANPNTVPHLFEKYQIRGVPTLIVLNSSGKVISQKVGGGEIGTLREKLDQFKDKTAIDPNQFR